MSAATSKKRFAGFLRNFVFGVEDSLVSTVGLLSGVAIADVPRGTIFLTGLILIFVEAFSMGVGSFLSEQSSEEYMKQGEHPLGFSVTGACIMFISYFISGFIPLFPYIMLETSSAFPVSVGCSLVALFLLGLWGGRLANLSMLKHGFRMMIIGGVAIGLGILVGALVNTSAFV